MLQKALVICLVSLLSLLAGCKSKTEQRAEPSVIESKTIQIIVTAKDTGDRLTEKQSIAFADVAIAIHECRAQMS